MRLLSRAQVKLPSLTLRTECLWYYPEHNPAEVTSKDKHRCCPCQKWADLFYSLTGLTDRFRYARVFFYNLSSLLKLILSKKQRVILEKNFIW